MPSNNKITQQKNNNIGGTGNFVMLNYLSMTVGGPWTRVCPADGRLSCLDLAIGSKELVQFVTALEVDSENKYTPRRAILKQGGLGLRYTDHFPLILEFMMPLAEPTEKLPAGWNLSKPGGWKDYERQAERMATKIEKFVEDSDITNEELMFKVDKVQDKIKHAVFGKTKPKATKKATKEMENKSDIEKAKELMSRQSEKMEAEILRIKSSKQGKTTNVFKMREVVAGKKKGKT